MQLLEVSCAVRLIYIYMSLGAKELMDKINNNNINNNKYMFIKFC